MLHDIPWNQIDWVVTERSDTPPQNWQQLIIDRAKDKRATHVNLVTTSDVLESYTAVANPYGGMYPEEDLAANSTLDRLFSYVADGGLFLNVADIPGYWAYSLQLRGPLAAVQPTWHAVRREVGETGLIETRPFDAVPWVQRLGLRIRGRATQDTLLVEPEWEHIVRESLPQVYIHRIAAVRHHMQPVAMRAFGTESPVFLVPYSEGHFLLSLLCLSHKHQPVARDRLKTLVVDLLLDEVERLVQRRTIRR
ncbi:MAG: hypothetical protein ACOC6F_01835 [bacterium]